MPVYRYQQASFDIAILTRAVPGSLTLGSTGPSIFVDVTAPSGSKSDLDAVMARYGWTFTSQDPASTPAANSAQETSLPWKTSARAATTANIALSGTQTIDTVILVAGDRAVVKNQTLPADNGVYVVASGAWARATDADTSTKLISGSSVVVTEGATNAGIWQMTTVGTIILGTTAIVFTKFTGGGASVTSTAPVNVTKAAAAVGTSVEAARQDHKHDITTAAPAQVGAYNTTSSEGSATSLARSDHVHQGSDVSNLIAWDHFVAGSTTTERIGVLGWLASVTGTGADLTVGSEAGHPGFMDFGAGTVAGGKSAIYLGDSSTPVVALGTTQNQVDMEWLVRFNTNALSSANMEQLFIGFGDQFAAAASTEPSNGVYAEFNPSVSANWKLTTATATVRTKVDSATVVAANVWIRVGIRMTYPAGVPTAALLINGTSVATTTLTIPTAGTGFGLRIEANATALEARCQADYMKWTQVTEKET